MSQIDQIRSFLRLASLAGASEALRAALDAGVVEALQGPPQTAAELSQICRVPESRLQLLLDVLVSLGAVERFGDDYALSTAMRLAGQHPELMRGEQWSGLGEYLGGAETAAGGEEPGEQAQHAYRGEKLSLQWTQTAAAMELAEVLQIGAARQGAHILELGAGGAMWSCALAYRDPTSRVTAVDFSEALEAARRTAEEIGIGPRVELLAGDYREVALPERTYDLALAVDLLALAPLAEARPWLDRVLRALRPGGELVVVGRFPGQPLGDLHRSLGALERALRVPDSADHQADPIRDVLRQAGFQPEPPVMLDAPPFSLGAIVARRR